MGYLKQCTKCTQEKEIELFEITNQGKRSTICKVCRNIRKAEIRKEKAIYSGRKPRRTFYEKLKDQEDGNKWCPGCESNFPKKEFIQLHGEPAVYCLLCSRTRGKLRTKDERRTYYSKRKDIIKNSVLKKKFGITKNEYDLLLIKQKYRCAICGKLNKEASTNNKSLAVDHDHTTGQIRGLLCTRCNPGLGFFNDDTNLLRKAITYLRKVQNRLPQNS